MWKVDDFDFDLPPDLIAHEPPKSRGESRLMVISKSKETITHARFEDLPLFLNPTDCLVFNNTKVIKARLYASRKTGGKVEVFLLKSLAGGGLNEFEAMVSPQRALIVGERLQLGRDVEIEILKKGSQNDQATIRFISVLTVPEILENYGQVPLPPYISHAKDGTANTYASRYQTVFAAQEGAVAAPTAGLHFTEEMIHELAQKHPLHYLTLHVGLGTFSPIKAQYLKDHQMHEEAYSIAPQTAQALSEHKRKGHRIIAIGTTVNRALESAWTETGCKSGTGETRLFITPGYRFQAVDCLFTNFHLPKSTLLVLIASFCGNNLIMKSYQEAILHRYRFYSFGDAMLILP